MAYTIDFTDSSVPGKTAFPIPEYRTEGPAHPLSPTLNGGTFSSNTASTSLLLVGKGVPNYGEIVQEGMVHMLENFASNGIPPVYETIGQLWYDYSTSTLNVYTGSWEGLLKLTGGEMSGNIDMGNHSLHNIALPSLPGDAVNKAYTDTTFFPFAGGTLTGPLILAADPTLPLEAATMQYVDSIASSLQTNVDSKLSISGGTLTGPLILAADPTLPLEAATMQYVGSTVTTAITTASSNYLQLAGGTLTGPLILAADPTLPLEAVTMQYVDNGFVPVGGGITMTGTFELFADPINPLEPATKQYVDAVVGGGGGNDGVVISGTIDPNTGILTLFRSIGTDVLINNIAAFVHTHSSTNVEYVVVNTGTTLDTTYGNGSTITIKNVIDTLDGLKADIDSPDFTGTASIENIYIGPSGTITMDSTVVVTLGQDPVQPLEAATKQYVDSAIISTGSITRSLITSTGQSIFTTPPYTVGANNLWVFVNGIKAYEGVGESYTEDSSTQITFTYTVPSGAKVEFLVFGV